MTDEMFARVYGHHHPSTCRGAVIASGGPPTETGQKRGNQK